MGVSGLLLVVLLIREQRGTDTLDRVILPSDPSEWLDKQQVDLVCKIMSKAPVHNFSVSWAKQPRGTNSTFTVFNETSNLEAQIGRPEVIARLHVPATPDEVQYQCAAVLKMDMSESYPLNATLQYKLIITPRLPGVLRLHDGARQTLTCSARANLSAEYTWTIRGNITLYNGSVTIHHMRVEDQGRYTCTATSAHGETQMNVTVEMTYDYLPVIAGCVASALVLLTALLCVLFFTCYRRKHMGQYILKNLTLHRQNHHMGQNQL